MVITHVDQVQFCLSFPCFYDPEHAPHATIRDAGKKNPRGVWTFVPPPLVIEAREARAETGGRADGGCTLSIKAMTVAVTLPEDYPAANPNLIFPPNFPVDHSPDVKRWRIMLRRWITNQIGGAGQTFEEEHVNKFAEWSDLVYQIQQEHSEHLLAEIKARRMARATQHAVKEADRKGAIAEAQVQGDAAAAGDEDDEAVFEAQIADMDEVLKEDARRSRRDHLLIIALERELNEGH